MVGLYTSINQPSLSVTASKPEFGFGNSVLVNFPQLFPSSREKACTMALFLLLHKICSLLSGWSNIAGCITLNFVPESTGITFQVFPESEDFSMCTFQLSLVSILDGDRIVPSGNCR